MKGSRRINIVTSHFKEDLSWLYDSPYPVHVVSKEGGDYVDESKFASVEKVPNFAQEASSYLWYIGRHYDNLPEKVAFIHGHENSTHQRLPILEAIERYGHLPFVDINRFMNMYIFISEGSIFRKIWDVLLKDELGSCPNIVNARGMAQFVVSREVIRSRSKDFYRNLYEKSLKFSVQDSDFFNFCSQFFEIFWHLIFGIESPLEDRPRENCFKCNSGELVIRQGAKEDEYLDMYVDSEFKVYVGLWEFMKKISS